jgi:hypothetical protein
MKMPVAVSAPGKRAAETLTMDYFREHDLEVRVLRPGASLHLTALHLYMDLCILDSPFYFSSSARVITMLGQRLYT